MPDEQNKGAGGAGGDQGGAGGAGQGQGGEGAGAGNGAGAGGAGQGQGAGGAKTETVDELKEKLRKAEEDRDNYKKVALQKKADERDLKNNQGGGEGGQGVGQGAANVIDEKKVGEVAAAAVTKTLRASSEKSAKRSFLQAHSEYADDAQWTALMSHLSFKGGEMTHDEVLDRMDAALLEHKRSTGKLEEYLRSEHERGVREGRIQGEFGSARGTGGAGDRGNNGGNGQPVLTPKGEEMARAMHVDPEKVKKVDTSKDNVISVV